MTHDMEALFAQLYETAGVARRAGERIAATQGQTQARWQTMWVIESGETLSVPQIARRLGVSRQNEQRVVNDLVASGHAELIPNPDHRTSPLVRLTPSGAEALVAIDESAAQFNTAVEADLTPEMAEQLRSLLGTLAESIRARGRL